MGIKILASDTMLTKKQVRRIFIYKDGVLFWRISPSQSTNKGDVAGYSYNNGYWRTKIKDKLYCNHRIIFLYQNGYMPRFIDHIDGNKLNNRIENLRECTKNQNCHNSKISKNNTSGVKGVTWSKAAKSWQAKIQINGKRVYVGYFKNIKDAGIAIRAERALLHKEFANHG